MRRIAISIPAFLVLAVAVTAFAEVVTSRKADKVKLQEGGAFDEDKQVPVAFGGKVKLDLRLRIDEFFDKKTVYVSGQAKNTADVPMHYQLYVSFYDKDGELVCAAGEASFDDDGIAPGETDDVNQCLMSVPPKAAAAIRSFRVVAYESKKAIGTE